MRQSSILLSSILWSAPCNNHLSRRAARGMRMAAAPPAMLSDSTPMQTGGGTGPSVYFVMGGCAAWALGLGLATAGQRAQGSRLRLMTIYSV